MAGRDIIVIGASMGGIEAIRTLLGQLPADLGAAVFVVQHVAEDGPGVLDAIFRQTSRLPVAHAQHGERFAAGHVYVAPPGHHLLLEERTLRLTRGPRENRARPAIDPLFRSAAVHHGTHVIGLLLTGFLDDGTAGLHAILRCGGTAIVQHPDDAAYPDMPSRALRSLAVPYCLPLASIAADLVRLTRVPAPASADPPTDLVREAAIAAAYDGVAPRGLGPSAADEDAIGDPAPLGCPECGGPLWRVRDEALRRYRCHLGHAFTGEHLRQAQTHAIEQALWAALRALREQHDLTAELARDAQMANRPEDAAARRSKAESLAGNLRTLEQLLLSLETPAE